MTKASDGLLERYSTRVLFVTMLGVFVAMARTWSVLGSGLPAAYVHDLVIHPRDNIVVIATHGRGMWAFDADKVNKKPERMRRRFEEE